MVLGRVAEDATRVRQRERLRGDAPSEQLLHDAARGIAVAGLELEPGGREPFLARRFRRAVAIGDLELVARASRYLAAAVDHRHALDDVPGFAAVAAGVHRQRAADRARNAGEEFRALEMVLGREARHLRAGDARFGVDHVVVGHRPAARAVREDHGAAPAAVAHQQVGAEPDEEQRLALRQLREKRAQIVEVGRDVEAVGSSAGAPAHVPRHGLPLPQLAA